MALKQAGLFYTAIQEALIEAGLNQGSVDKLFSMRMGGIDHLETVVRNQLGADQSTWYDICVRNNDIIDVRGRQEAKEVYLILLPLLEIFGSERAIEALNAATKEFKKEGVNSPTS